MLISISRQEVFYIRVKFKNCIENCLSARHSKNSSIVCVLTTLGQFIIFFGGNDDKAQDVYNQLFINGYYDASEDDYDYQKF